ncbi:MAG TPA: RAMP superfamily CRISPR-associated protein, partial [Anaerolineae bacterium]|nr:RAMP superfamily CRISPR-associated protein [Anaerolineae bacterium]
LLAWLERPVEGIAADADSDDNIQMLLHQTTLPPNHRDYLDLEASFALTTSLLIRSESGDPADPDVTHLRSNGRPVLSGTSLAGALRARALRIANTLKLPQADNFVTRIFGGEIERSDRKELVASRLIVDETVIEQGLDMVQSRVKIDRFTGGAFPGALFSEQPVFGQPETQVQIKARLVAPTPAEIGLVLMLLKDLWTGDLPLGGEAGIGRGRLAGRDASLTYQGQTWSINQPPGQALAVDSATRRALQQYADALKEIAQ